MQTSLLDSVYLQMEDSDGDTQPVTEALDTLTLGLDRIRDAMTPADWQRYIASARQHPLVHLLHQDPFTCRSYYKPRGYPGDPKLIDYIYGFLDDDLHVTALGRTIMKYGVNSQACRAVRRRRDLLAESIVKIRRERPEARVLSVACGHLREAHLAIDEAPVKDFVAIDQDPKSISTTRTLFAEKGVQAMEWRLRDLMGGRRRDLLGGFDFIYSAGLYDYVSDETARRLTRELFRMLTPGGTLLVANFVPELEDIGYMEAFMDWHLSYRPVEQMPECADLVDPREVASQRVFTEENEAIAFLEIVRA